MIAWKFTNVEKYVHSTSSDWAVLTLNSHVHSPISGCLMDLSFLVRNDVENLCKVSSCQVHSVLTLLQSR